MGVNNSILTVICGIITNTDGKIFIARRKKDKLLGGKWEFPGGKIEKDETQKECLQRELNEEFAMQIKVGERLGENEHQYENFSILLIAYNCEFISATFELMDHDAYEWIAPEDLSCYDMAEADRPFLEMITKRIKS